MGKKYITQVKKTKLLKVQKMIFLLTIVILTFISAWFLNYIWSINMNVTEGQALKIALAAESSLNIDYIKLLHAVPEDKGSIPYETIKSNMSNLSKTDKNIRFAYLYTRKGDGIYFMVDSEPASSKDYSPPGQKYTEAKAEDFMPFENGKALVEKPLTDRWGTWVSVLVPIKNNQTGDVIAVLGLDYPVKAWYSSAISDTLQAAIIVLAAFVLTITFFILMKKNILLKEKQGLLHLAGEEARNNEQKYRLLITQMPQGMAFHDIICDDDGKPVDYRFISVNESFEKLTGLVGKDIIGKTVLEVLPNTEKYWIETYGKVALTGVPYHYHNFSSELNKYFSVSAYSPQPMQFATIVSDITERKKLEKALIIEKEQFKTTLLSVGDGVISTDAQGNVTVLNKVAEKFSGWVQSDAFGKPLEQVFNIVNEFTGKRCENPAVQVLTTGDTISLANHTVLISRDGSQTPIEDSAAPIKDEQGNTTGVVLVFRDFTEKKKKQQEIEYLSYHDQLTGLYNRRFYEADVARLDNDVYYPLTLVMADVNGLKLTNDAFGHDAGDLVLEKIAAIIKRECRSQDIAARIGGDEFVVLLPKTDSKNAGLIIDRINAAIAKEQIKNLILSVSIGFAVKADKSCDMNEVFKQAEDLMYRNKLSESSSMRSKTIDLILNSLFEKNEREMLHSQRVSDFCEAIAKEMNFSKDDINQMRIAGLMHDIGKIGISETALNKPGKLRAKEWAEIKRHSEIGYRILGSVNEFSKIADYVLEHHERLDGTGYPKGLKGQDISLQARIISLADAYDAMTTDRSYRQGLSTWEALAEIKKCSGSQFDPEIAKIFIEKVLHEMW